MELHTVGVNGGYSQADVTNLAKILTGWTIDQPQQGGGFVFDLRKHEPGSKQWFGQKVSENGYVEGQRALEWLAAQPQTAHFISYKLAQRFVCDDPPEELVDRMAKTYMATDGDIKEILRTMVHSPEFNSQKYYRVKVKTPLEFVASVFRATDTNPANPGALVGVIGRMGEPLYQMQPPTGYSTTADHWMNSGALVDRLNFSMQFANSKVGGIKFDAPRLLAEGLLARTATAACVAPRWKPGADRSADFDGVTQRPGGSSRPDGADAGRWQSLRQDQRRHPPGARRRPILKRSRSDPRYDDGADFGLAGIPDALARVPPCCRVESFDLQKVVLSAIWHHASNAVEVHWNSPEQLDIQ